MKPIHIHDILRARLLARAGCPDVPPPKMLPDHVELYRTQWSPEFEAMLRAAVVPAPLEPTFLELMHNRLIMGALRYGLLGRANKPAYDNVGSILRRLKAYARDGNSEHMVDTANIALVEYVEGKHPQRNQLPADLHYAAEASGYLDINDQIRSQLSRYVANGNVLHLVQVAALAHGEFLYSAHPKAHFATGDGDIHSAPA